MKKIISILIIGLFVSMQFANGQVKKVHHHKKKGHSGATHTKTTVQIDNAKLFDGHSTTAPVLETMTKDSEIIIYNTVRHPFIKAKYNGKIGFVKIGAVKTNRQMSDFLRKGTKQPKAKNVPPGNKHVKPMHDNKNVTKKKVIKKTMKKKGE